MHSFRAASKFTWKTKNAPILSYFRPFLDMRLHNPKMMRQPFDATLKDLLEDFLPDYLAPIGSTVPPP
jgi:hypothetical protein